MVEDGVGSLATLAGPANAVRAELLPDILVVGDAAIDWYEERFESTAIRSPETARSTINTPGRGGWTWHEMPGGMLLLDRMLFEALERPPKPRARIVSPIGVRDEKREKFPRDAIDGDQGENRKDREGLVHSLAVIRWFEKGDTRSLRVIEYRGFTVARPGWRPDALNARPAVLRFPIGDREQQSTPQFVLIDDAGNGFRDDPDAWPALVRSETCQSHRQRTVLVLKLSEPLPSTRDPRSNSLWGALKDRRSAFGRRLVIVTADDLRRGNSDISFRLSWDRTVEDLIRCAFDSGSALAELSAFGDVIVRFGLDGAALIPEGMVGTQRIVTLICDPRRIEGDTEREIWALFHDTDPSHVAGVTATFTAAIVSAFLETPPARDNDTKEAHHATRGLTQPELLDAITDGLAAAETLYASGLKQPPETLALTYPYELIFGRSPIEGDETAWRNRWKRFQRYSLETPLETPYGRRLANLAGSGGSPLVDITREYARMGSRALVGVPCLEMGELTTADRDEIENYRSIANLIEAHLSRRDIRRPLSIAVFGPPGAGKSFGVKQIALHLGRGLTEVIETNVAQFTDQKDLIRTFHEARDQVINGKIPLIFFDEFDANNGVDPCGWLKFFLSPMQDGKFKDEARVHAIERAIFVFAGGTRYSLQAFADPNASENAGIDIRAEKRPDFVSRLHGFISLRGPNPSGINADDPGFVMRRAILLRNRFQVYGPSLFDNHDPTKTLSIADPVLNAFLEVDRYKHGARSIEAIIRMSAITPASEHFKQSMLPSREQLDLHVDGREFENLLRSWNSG